MPCKPALVSFNRIDTSTLFSARDKATYNWPCEKISSMRYKPRWQMDCPCALLIDIAKANHTGNCRRWRLKGRRELSDNERGICGMKDHLPACGPVMITASITRRLSCDTTSLVPLHRPAAESRFRKSMIEQPILRDSRWSGKPLMLMLLRNSDGKSVFDGMPVPEGSTLLSALGKICMSEVIQCKIAEFRSSTSLFWAARIARLQRYWICCASVRPTSRSS